MGSFCGEGSFWCCGGPVSNKPGQAASLERTEERQFSLNVDFKRTGMLLPKATGLLPQLPFLSPSSPWRKQFLAV
ncbi:Ectonucleoside triphosphate diphosphohydrolase 4 [Manis javanica]|nr:Ectonucleoside triphosphate diphosphohydrolase 4 [Manis javanica]